MTTTPAPKAKTTKSDVEPRIIMRGTTQFRHDLYKSDVQPMKRNTSFKRGKPNLVDIEHMHVYHSCDSRGRPFRYSSTTAGHFHKVTCRVDPATGEMVAESGPPLWNVTVNTEEGQRRVVEPVKWENKKRMKDGDENMDGDARKVGSVSDNHHHAWRYVHSEVMSDERVRQIQTENREATASLGAPTIHSPNGRVGNDGTIDGE